jgi:DHA1 family bicyclomycin/chloramphenicol resistance-like MFS transporter
MSVVSDPAAPPEDAAAARLLLILSLLMAFGPMSTDMYLPALPAMATALHASDAQLQWTLSSFLVGFGLGQLVWGPIGDRFGRRIPVLAAVLLYLVATLGCVLAASVHQMIFWRCLQALAACAGPVLARAMVRDVYGRERAARALSLLMLVMGVAPLLAPSIGGQALLWFGWRAVFWTQMGFGVAALIGALFLRETLAPPMRASLKLPDVLFGYAGMLAHRRFLGAALAGAFFYAGCFAFLAGSPFAYVDYHHVPAELYGLLFAINIAGMMALNVVNRRLVMRLGPERLLLLGICISAAGGVVLAIAGRTGIGGLAGLVVPIFFYISMLGLVSANAMAVALSAFPHRAGSASALAGGLQFGFGAISSIILGLVNDGTPWPMTAIMAVSGLLALATALLLRRGVAEAPLPVAKPSRGFANGKG